MKKAGSDSRLTATCPYYGKCGGCSMLEYDYAEQLKRKYRRIEQLLKPYCRVEGIIGMEEPYHYRNKVHAVFSADKRGKIVSGIYQEGTHKVVAVEHCLIENEEAGRIISTVEKLVSSFKFTVYDEDRQRGLFRHILVRTAHATGEIMVVLVLGSNIFPSKNNFVKALLKEHPEITTIVMNVNDRRTSMVLGERQQVLHGKGFIEDRLCGYTFRISPNSFYQINSDQTEVLYAKALEYAALTGRETVVDAYCGIGTIGIAASAKAGKVIGVELNKAAVSDAVLNARRNDVKNIQFFCADAGTFMTQMAQSGKKADVLFMDPPRSGSDETFLACAAELAPERIVYISCGPESLARDLGVLTRKGYKAVRATAVDMFPQTREIETVVVLSK